MGILKLIYAILKAVPVLGRLFNKASENIKEKKASDRYEEKLNLIDSAVDKYHRAGLRDNSPVQQHEGTDVSPGVPQSGVPCPGVHKGSTQKISKPRVRARKKVAKKKSVKKKVANAKEKRPTARKSRSKRVQQTKKDSES